MFWLSNPWRCTCCLAGLQLPPPANWDSLTKFCACQIHQNASFLPFDVLIRPTAQGCLHRLTNRRHKSRLNQSWRLPGTFLTSRCRAVSGLLWPNTVHTMCHTLLFSDETQQCPSMDPYAKGSAGIYGPVDRQVSGDTFLVCRPSKQNDEIGTVRQYQSKDAGRHVRYQVLH